MIHCTLPTRVRAPTGKGTHLDGPFLLSVDRGSLDGTHAWNAALLQHGLGELLVKLLRWAARACRDADDKAKVLRDAFSRLPPLTRDADGKLSATVAGATVSLHALDSALRRESLLPCLPLGTFRTAREARWVPPAFAERVPAPVLKDAVRGRAAREDLLGDAFADNAGRGPASSRRRRRLARRPRRRAARRRLWCRCVERRRGAPRGRGRDAELDAGLAVRSFGVDGGRRAGCCRFLDDDVASLPEALPLALEAAAPKAVDGNGKDAPRLAHRGAMASPLSRGAQGFLAALRKGPRQGRDGRARGARGPASCWGSGDAALFVALAAWAKDILREALSMYSRRPPRALLMYSNCRSARPTATTSPPSRRPRSAACPSLPGAGRLATELGRFLAFRRRGRRPGPRRGDGLAY